MRTIILILLLLVHTTYAHAATKTLTPDGQAKLTAWAQKVARIYGTALKNMPSGVVKTENLDIYVYARSADGLFTTSGYARVNYTNSNMTFTPSCMGSGTTLALPGPQAWCLTNLQPIESAKNYGSYGSTLTKRIGLDPGEAQINAFGTGHASCLGNQWVTAFNLSCIHGVQKYISNSTNYKSWTALSVEIANGGCQASAALPVSLSPVSSISCATKVALDNIKSKLDAYKTYLGTCNNGVLSAAMNIDLTEVTAVLNDMQNGVVLASGDIQGDTNPPAARDPWTFTNPTLAVEGLTSQTHLVGNILPDKFKVRVTNAAGVIPVVFSVSPPDGGWAFIPEGGQAVTRNTVNGIAETGFKLGSVPGTYPIKATCAECCPGEVAFSATALTNTQATELQPYYCNTSAFINSALDNGVRVRAINRFTSKAVPNRQVTFTLVSHPGGTGMGLTTPTVPPTNPPTADTNAQGIARANLTLGTLPGNYRISAVCQACEGNREVTCNVNALANPELFDVSPQVTPLVLKKSPIKVTLQHYVIDLGANTQVSVEGPAGLGLVASVVPVPNTGGHQHTNGERLVGTIAPIMTSITANGNATFTYTAGAVGGQERIIISAPEIHDYGDAVVLVSVPGLARLGPGAEYRLIGETGSHPSDHYGSQTLLQEIRDIASVYADTYQAFIYVNDMSLINGGLFDHLATWASPHAFHKSGSSVDFSRWHYLIASRITRRARNIASNIAALADNTGNGINCRRINEDNLQTAADLRQYGSLAHFECPR